jgi:hypothetical protein
VQILVPLLLILAALLVIGWLGLQVRPRPFVMPALSKLETGFVPLPSGLPRPVERFFRDIYGETLPVIRSAVLVGRCRIHPFGVWLPARFIFIHDAGQAYRHYMEATFFGLPLLKVNEGYVDGRSFFESPMAATQDDPNTNQGANLALWAEAGWFPSLWATDARVRWTEVDATTALLVVPFEGSSEHFVVRFDPQSGLIDTMEAMRYRSPGEGQRKILWITRNEPGPAIPGTNLRAVGSATWMDQGKPWAVFTLEQVATNVDVRAVIRARGC